MDSSNTPIVTDTIIVQLKSFSNRKLNVVKSVKVLTGLGLKEAKKIVDEVPSEFPSRHGFKFTFDSLTESGAEFELFNEDNVQLTGSSAEQAPRCPHCGQEIPKN